MPEMYEIYEKHADRYEELVRAEDYQDNLRDSLQGAVNWEGLSVIEGGVGTGRVTRLYIEEAALSVCCDRSRHMLDSAQEILSKFENKLRFVRADNTDLPDFGGGLDVFVEGWSFGHSVSDCSSISEVREMTRILIQNATRNLRPGGLIILLETLGTNVTSPGAPNDRLKAFYKDLETQHGFALERVRTDYRFQTNEEAARIMGFFFGAEMQESVRKRNTEIIPEWTGMWTKTMPT
jgi:SAM-dependent methyltransferase